MNKIIVILSGLAAAIVATPAFAQQAWEICNGHYIIDNATGQVVAKTSSGCHVEGGFYPPRGHHGSGYAQGHGGYRGGGYGRGYANGWDGYRGGGGWRRQPRGTFSEGPSPFGCTGVGCPVRIGIPW